MNDTPLHLRGGCHRPFRRGDGHLAVFEGDINVVNGDRSWRLVHSRCSAIDLDGEEDGTRCVVLDLQDATVACLCDDIRRSHERAVDETLLGTCVIVVRVFEEGIHIDVGGRQEVVKSHMLAPKVEVAALAV